MQEVFKRIAVVAPTDCAVLITGESGTGKELTAQAVHRHSNRRKNPLIPIHLAALSPTVVESELFGHCRGAYTGADSAKAGLLELANEGTVFFDEIGDVPLDIQVKLLRAIEQREVIPVGGTQARRTEFRLIAATNRDLRQEIAQGRFRADLYFRLAAFEITLPPLRERTGDIDLLIDHFLGQTKIAGKPLWLSNAARHQMHQYHWPGNVRQLRNVVQSAALLARQGEITPDHLALERTIGEITPEAGDLSSAIAVWTRDRLQRPEDGPGLYEEFLTAVEKPLLEVVLRSTAQNRAAAAEILGIDRATLRKKLS
jgi:two-component system nitrogen regulation response regulator GlnG